MISSDSQADGLPLPPPLDVVPHTEKDEEKQRRVEEAASFVSMPLKTSLSPISGSRLLSGCSLGEAARAHLIFSVCSRFPIPLCLPALQPSLLDGDSLSKDAIKFQVTSADTQ